MDLQEIKDTLKDAAEYLKSLEKLNLKIDSAKEQISRTAQETQHHIESTFNTLIANIAAALSARRDILIRKTHKIQENSLLPLEDCKSVVNCKIANTKDFIRNGNSLLNAPENRHHLAEFLSKSSLLGSLPEVPPVNDVPYITFKFELKAEKALLSTCSSFGSVTHTPPVQINTFTEKSGAVLIEWQPIELDEQIGDIQEYKVQKALGDFNAERHLQFRDCYSGLDNQYLVKNLIENQPYTFRVCCKFEGQTEWSPWSLPVVTCTTLRPFTWHPNSDFVLSNDDHIATPIENKICMIFSDGIHFTAGDSVEYTFVDIDENLEDNYIGLFLSDQTADFSLTETTSVIVEATGSIYSSGQKKSTQFHPVQRGTKICFSCDMRSENKLRINIDAKGGRVTYDWMIGEEKIYFGARLKSAKWKLMIE